MNLESAKTQSQLKGTQRAKMEKSPVSHEYYTSLLHTGQRHQLQVRKGDEDMDQGG
jgi:hypothetical protein